MSVLVLFDIDKTMLKSNTVYHRQAFHYAILRVYGVDAALDDISHDGMTDKQIIVGLLRFHGLGEAAIRPRLAECMGLVGSLFSSNKLGAGDFVLLEGIKELISELERRSIIIGLVTGNVERVAAEKLKAVKLHSHFKVGGFGDSDEVRANLVKIAVGAAQRDLGLGASDAVFVIGDTPRDVEAGRLAGARTIAVATGNYTEGQLSAAGADFVLRDLKDTKRILRIIGAAAGR